MPLVTNQRRYSRALIAAICLIVVGWLPLPLSVIIMKAQGDPNPNPIGPGLLFFFTAWPAIILLIIGIVRTKRLRRAMN
jgi:hypothetical protein